MSGRWAARSVPSLPGAWRGKTEKDQARKGPSCGTVACRDDRGHPPPHGLAAAEHGGAPHRLAPRRDRGLDSREQPLLRVGPFAAALGVRKLKAKRRDLAGVEQLGDAHHEVVVHARARSVGEHVERLGAARSLEQGGHRPGFVRHVEGERFVGHRHRRMVQPRRGRRSPREPGNELGQHRLEVGRGSQNLREWVGGALGHDPRRVGDGERLVVQ